MADKPAFNGTNKEIRALFQKWLDDGGSSADFNKQFSSITVGGRTVKGVRTDGVNKKTGKLKIKINYKDTVDRYEGKRGSALGDQTHGPKDMPQTPGMRDHHMRPPSIYQTFFEGLDDADKAELARYAAEDLMAPLGDKDFNDAILNQWEHDQAYHAWDRGHDGVKPGQSEPTNFQMPEDATLAQRKKALEVFIKEGPQAAMDEALFTARMGSQHPDHPHWKGQLESQYNIGEGPGKISPPKLKTTNGVTKLFSGFDNAAIMESLRSIKSNPTGAALGAAGFLEPEAVTSLMEGKPGEAAKQTAVGVATGTAVSQAAKGLATAVPKAVPALKVLGGVAGLAAPLAWGAHIGTWMRDNVEESSFTSGRGSGRTAFN